MADEMSQCERYSALAECDALAGVHGSRVLVVGAGGIGCELLKALVLHGFEQIETIDLDTVNMRARSAAFVVLLRGSTARDAQIDVSNLNRQFLFRREHVGKPKAEVAAEAVRRFNPRASVKGTLANITEARFGVDFFRQFTFVANALDNLAARRHVNRLCLAAKVPLIESGTAGFLGQVSVIIGGETECYECQPKPTPKTFAVCTINSTPSKPVHCIVWAKKLYADHFGADAAADALAGADEYAAGPAAAADERLRADAATLAAQAARGTRFGAFHRNFCSDILSRRVVAELAGKTPWAGRTAPTPLSLSDAEKLTDGGAAGEDQVVPSVANCAKEFLDSFAELEAREEQHPFDKDDDLAMRFVCAAANLRAHLFGIARQSPFAAKSIAGHIVPAIATTNAVIAGLVVLEALKLARGSGPRLATYLLKQPSAGRKLLASPAEPPNPACFVCQKELQRASQTLSIDTEQTTLEQLLGLLKSELAFVRPQVMRGDTYLFESGEGLDEDEVAEYDANRSKTMAELGLVHNVIATVDDFSQDMSMQLIIMHRSKADFDKEQGEGKETATYHQFQGKAPKAQATSTEAASDASAACLPCGAAADADADDDDELEIVDGAAEEAPADSAKPGEKRARADSPDAADAKKSKGEPLHGATTDDAIEISE